MRLLHPVTSLHVPESQHSRTSSVASSKEGDRAREIHCSRSSARKSASQDIQRTGVRGINWCARYPDYPTVTPSWNLPSREVLISRYFIVAYRRGRFRFSSIVYRVPVSEPSSPDPLTVVAARASWISPASKDPSLDPGSTRRLGYPLSESSRQFSVVSWHGEESRFSRSPPSWPVEILTRQPVANGFRPLDCTVTNRGKVSVEVLGIGPDAVRLVEPRQHNAPYRDHIQSSFRSGYDDSFRIRYAHFRTCPRGLKSDLNVSWTSVTGPTRSILNPLSSDNPWTPFGRDRPSHRRFIDNRFSPVRLVYPVRDNDGSFR